MNINFRYIIIALAALLGFTTSCTDDYGSDLPVPDPASKGLTLRIPDAVDFVSRAPGDNGAAELTYSSLYLFAFPQGSGELLITPLATGAGSPGFVSGGYRTYPLSLKNGIYRFFLVANHFAAGLESSDLPQSEEALKDELLSFGENFNFIIPDTGIPMSADNSDFSFRDNSGDTSTFTSFQYNGQTGTLIADLTFCYAKVTVVPTDASGDPAQLTDVKVSNYSAQEPLFFEYDYSYGTNAGPKEVKTTYQGKNIEQVVVSHTIYVPERYITEASAATTLSMKIGDKDISLPLGQLATAEANTENPIPDIANGEIPQLRRSYHYVYNLTSTDKINVVVEPWTAEVLTAKLNGPVYLHIEKDEYEITAGVDTPIWFDSSVGKELSIKSPTFTYTTAGGESITCNLYESTVNATADTLRVWVNDAIPSAEYTRIKESIANGEGKYDYFHIVAGNIMKRINVSPLSLDYYLRINPENIALDVKLRVASGEYQGDLPVSIRSNYPQVKVYLVDGWSSIPDDVTAADIAKAIQIRALSKDGPAIEGIGFNKGISSEMTGGRIQYFVTFNGLNSGWNFWKKKRTLTFEVAGIDENGDTQASIPVTINVIPSILNYKIHFKAAGWENPHIYIYQCLEFPGDYKGTYKKNSDTIALANKPIGYQDGNEMNAALKYSFSGAVSFRGWDFPANHDLLYNTDGSQILTPAVEDNQGFYMFTGQKDSWDVQHTFDKAAVRYNYNYDFCEEHRREVSQGSEVTKKYCPYCAWEYNKDGFTMNRLWPGIKMKREAEDDGWYEFELTGIAEPGKTLIMFANVHTGDTNDRFPGDHKVGVPLFDFPEREGWLLYNGNITDREKNNFTATKPGSAVVTTNGYRIYWPTSTGYEKIAAWIVGTGTIASFESGTPYSGVTSDNRYYYYDFNKNISSSSQLGFVFFNQADDQTDDIFVGVNTFTLDSNEGRRCAYYNGSEIVSGVPSSTPVIPSQDYCIYWPASQNNSNQANIWIDGVGTVTDWNGGTGTVDGGYRKFQFPSTASSTDVFNVQFHSGDNKYNGNYGYPIQAGACTANASGVKCAWFDGSTWHPGEPPVKRYRIFWPESSDYKEVHVWDANFEQYKIVTWNSGLQNGSLRGYYYRDFETNVNDDIKVILHNNSSESSVYGPYSLSTFTLVTESEGNNRYCAYISGTSLSSGLPPEQVVTSNTYRIYWPETQDKSNQLYLWIENGNNDIGIIDWSAGQPQGTTNGYRYYQFNATVSSNQEFGYIFHSGGDKYNNDDAYVSVSKFTDDGNGVKCAYFLDDTWYSGIPTNEYRIYWQKSYNGTNYTNIHVWLTPGGEKTSWPGAHTGESGNYYYLDFESDDPYASIGYLFTNNGSKVTGDLGGKLTTFTPKTVDNQKKKNCAYYNGSNLVSGKP